MAEKQTYVLTIRPDEGTREIPITSPARVLSLFLAGFLACAVAALSPVALGMDDARVNGHAVFAYWVPVMIVFAMLFLIGFGVNLAKQAGVSIRGHRRDRS